ASACQSTAGSRARGAAVPSVARGTSPAWPHPRRTRPSRGRTSRERWSAAPQRVPHRDGPRRTARRGRGQGAGGMTVSTTTSRLDVFERYLSAWVALCIAAGVVIGSVAPGVVGVLSRLEVRHVNLPIALLIWLMIYPMMVRIDFGSLRDVGRRPAGLLIVVFVNWLVKPFSMATLGWLFFKHLFAGLVGPELGDQYLAGTIILA